MNCQADENLQSWFCLTHEKKGLMIRWNENFVQWGERVYFDQNIDPKLYFELKPSFSILNKGAYQDPLDWGNTDSKKYQFNLPYNITRTNENITLKYLVSGQVFSLSEDSSGNIFRSNDAKGPYKRFINGEIKFVINYYSYIHKIHEINFDFSTQTVTETIHDKLTEEIGWRKQISKRENGQEITDPSVYLTPEENKELYHKMISSLKERSKYVKTATCKKDNALKSYFRNMGNIFSSF